LRSSHRPVLRPLDLSRPQNWPLGERACGDKGRPARSGRCGQEPPRSGHPRTNLPAGRPEAAGRSRSTDHREPRRLGLDHGAVVRLRTHAVSAEEGTAADREAFIEGSHRTTCTASKAHRSRGGCCSGCAGGKTLKNRLVKGDMRRDTSIGPAGTGPCPEGARGGPDGNRRRVDACTGSRSRSTCRSPARGRRQGADQPPILTLSVPSHRPYRVCT
jgi:hypothetical protein